MIQRLFPAAQCHVGGPHYGSDWKTQWLQNRRVAHEYVLRLYLERVVGEGLESFMQAEHAWACMADQKALDTYLRSLDPKRLHAVIHSLETYEGQFAREHVVPGSVVLLNLMPDLPEGPKGMFELDSSVYVTRVVYRLLRSIRDGEQIAQIAQSILRELRTLSAKLELIDIVGHRENVGHKLVSESAARELERAWRDEVRSTSADAMQREAGPSQDLAAGETRIVAARAGRYTSRYGADDSCTIESGALRSTTAGRGKPCDNSVLSSCLGCAGWRLRGRGHLEDADSEH